MVSYAKYYDLMLRQFRRQGYTCVHESSWASLKHVFTWPTCKKSSFNSQRSYTWRFSFWRQVRLQSKEISIAYGSTWLQRNWFVRAKERAINQLLWTQPLPSFRLTSFDQICTCRSTALSQNRISKLLVGKINRCQIGWCCSAREKLKTAERKKKLSRANSALGHEPRGTRLKN